MKINNNTKISYFDKRINLTLPEHPSEELAEFIGILTGDGYMNKYGKYFSLLEIAGDSLLDKEYLSTYVSPMIKSLFNLEPKIIFRKKQRTMYLRLMSKGINNYLLNVGFKEGKKEQIGIPSWVLENKDFMKSFIRGLADTDGSLVLLNRKQKKYTFYPRVQIASISKVLVITTSNWLKEQGISLSIMKEYKTLKYKGETKDHQLYRIHISGRKNLEKWMQLVSFRNERHLSKYKKYKESGSTGI